MDLDRGSGRSEADFRFGMKMQIGFLLRNRFNRRVCGLPLLATCIVSGCRLAIMTAVSSLTGGAGAAVVFHIVAIYEATAWQRCMNHRMFERQGRIGL